MSILVGLLSWIFFLLFQAQGISVGDSGDLVTAAATFGVPHPPGYPLYTFLGWLLHYLPFSTVAWRVTLLSSLPHAVVIGFVYFFVRSVTRKPIAALFASMAMVGNYLVFLYSVTPEVFALFDLFVVLVLYLTWRWVESGKYRYVYYGSFILGLALTHHQLIIFLFPVFLYALFLTRKRLASLPSRFYLRIGLFFLLGLLPYLYIVAASRGPSIINWDRATTLDGFVRLLTRADYGTFKSGAFYGAQLIQRLLGVKVYLQFIFFDFRFLGVGMMALGWYALWRRQRNLFSLLAMSILLLGPVFVFYASFPMVNSFLLATYERFLLPSYTILFVVIGCGVSYFVDLTRRVLDRVLSKKLRTPMLYLICGLLFLYPVSLISVTAWRFWGLPHDMTAEYLGEDILTSLPPDSLLILDRDTTLFTAQYVRYVKEERPDLVVVHANRLWWDDYRQVVARVFPRMSLPTGMLEFSLPDFIKTNIRNRQVFANSKYAVGEEWAWVPHGLVFELKANDALPAVTTMKAENERIWQLLHDPTKGILSRYNHLMLSDVRDVYASARIEFGKILMKANDLPGALEQFKQAVVLGGDTQLPVAYMYKGLVELFSKDCTGAIASFAKANEAGLVPDKNITLYEAVTYRDCVGEAKKSQELFDLYKKQEESEQIPLQGL